MANSCLSLAVVISLQMKLYFSVDAMSQRYSTQPPVYENLSVEDNSQTVSEEVETGATPRSPVKENKLYPKWVNVKGYNTLDDLEVYESTMTPCEWLLYLKECKCDRSTIPIHSKEATIEVLSKLEEFPFQTLSTHLEEFLRCGGQEEDVTHLLGTLSNSITALPEFVLKHLDQESRQYVTQRFGTSSLSQTLSFGKALELLRKGLEETEAMPKAYTPIRHAFDFYTLQLLPRLICQKTPDLSTIDRKTFETHWDLIKRLESANITQIVLGD
jgi:hypothetical protein